MDKSRTGRLLTQPTRSYDASPSGADATAPHRHRRRPLPPLYEPVPNSDHQLDGVVAAAEHLMGLGLPPLFPLDTLRALWKREPDRELACALARLAGAR